MVPAGQGLWGRQVRLGTGGYEGKEHLASSVLAEGVGPCSGLSLSQVLGKSPLVPKGQPRWGHPASGGPCRGWGTGRGNQHMEHRPPPQPPPTSCRLICWLGAGNFSSGPARSLFITRGLHPLSAV